MSPSCRAEGLAAALVLLAPGMAWGQPLDPLVEVRSVRSELVQDGVQREIRGWCVNVGLVNRPDEKRLARCALRDGRNIYIVQLKGALLSKEWEVSVEDGAPTAEPNRDRFLALIEAGADSRPLASALKAEGLHKATQGSLRRVLDHGGSEPTETVACVPVPCATFELAISQLRDALMDGRAAAGAAPQEPPSAPAMSDQEGSGTSAVIGDLSASGPATQLSTDAPPSAPADMVAAGPAPASISTAVPPVAEPWRQPPAQPPQLAAEIWLPPWLLLLQIVLLLAAVGVGVWTLLVALGLSARRPAQPELSLRTTEPRPPADDPVVVVQLADRLIRTWLGADAIGAEEMRVQLANATRQLADLRTLTQSFPDQTGHPPAALITLLYNLPIELQALLQSMRLAGPSGLDSLVHHTGLQIESLKRELTAVRELARAAEREGRKIGDELARYRALLDDLSEAERQHVLGNPEHGMGSVMIARALRAALRQLDEAYEELTAEGRTDVVETLELQTILRELPAFAGRVAELTPAGLLSAYSSGSGWQLVHNVLRAALLASVYLPDRGATRPLRQGLDRAATAIREELALAGVQIEHGRLLSAPEPGDEPKVARKSPLMRLPEARAMIERLLPLADAKDLVIDYQAFARTGGSVSRAAEPLTLVPAEWQWARTSE